MLNEEKRWTDLNKILLRSGPLSPPEFEPSEEVSRASSNYIKTVSILKSVKLLVIGAGGLGCEILKNLALSSFKDIHVIDMDTIDLSNLNRQFLFRNKDVGRPKAEVAAAFITQRIPGVKVTAHYAKIQDFDDDFYRQFGLIICGLDSVEARRWINATVYKLYDLEDPSTIIPIIDGGTEGFKGQSRVIIPGQTSCYECSLEMFTKRAAFPLCTIANTPRLPEHCIEWASVLEWPKAFPDADNPEHLTWLFTTASNRAKEFNITGVTYTLTQGVVKNIIPAIASTNAIIAASLCNEALKMVTSSGPMLKTYMMYTGDEGVYTYTFEHQKNPNCAVCGNPSLTFRCKPELTLQELIEKFQEMPEMQVKKPSLRAPEKTLYMQAPPALEQATRPNLDKTLKDLIKDGDEIVLTDSVLQWKVTIKFV